MKRFLILFLLVVPFVAMGQQSINDWLRMSGEWAVDFDLQISSNDTIALTGQDTVAIGPYRAFPEMAFTFNFVDSTSATDSVSVTKIEYRQSRAQTYTNAVLAGSMKVISTSSATGATTVSSPGVYVGSPQATFTADYHLPYYWLVIYTDGDNRKVAGNYVFVTCTGWHE